MVEVTCNGESRSADPKWLVEVEVGRSIEA